MKTSTMIRRGPVSAEPRDESPDQRRQRKRRSAKFDLRFHYGWTRGFFGLGRRICVNCGERWGQDGCAARVAALETFVSLTSEAEVRQAVREQLLTAAEADLRPDVARAKVAPTGDPFALMGMTTL